MSDGHGDITTATDTGRELELYNPGEGLKAIAVAEAAEKHGYRELDRIIDRICMRETIRIERENAQ
jgi:hypothetical protein